MKIHELNQPEWDEWVNSRPTCIQELVRRYPPSHLYSLRTTGQRVVPVAYNEDGTLRVFVPPEYNPARVMTGHCVFGIKPEDLESLPESEAVLIEVERKEMEPVAFLRDALTEAVFDPANRDAVRSIIGVDGHRGESED